MAHQAEVTVLPISEERCDTTDAMFRLLLDAVQDYAIFALDVSGRVVTWNAGAERLNGYTADEIIGTHFSHFYTPEDIARGHPAEELKQAVLVGRYHEEGWRVRKDGVRFWAEVVITPLKDSIGKHFGFAKVNRDLSERKQAEDVLRQAYENLELTVKERTAELVKAKDVAEQAVRVRDEFLSIASHELRTPLTTLLLQLQIFNRILVRDHVANGKATVLSNKAIEVVAKCEEQGRKLTLLLDELLDLTRIRLGRIQLEKQRVDLGALVRSVVEQLQLEAQKKGSTISLRIEDEIVGFWDLVRMEQIVRNLLSNAVKYGEGKPIHVTVDRDETQTKAKITVSDQGIGIPKEAQGQIFERFERVHAETQRIPGLGLGLYICRQITQAHGGSIYLESEEGKGATFTVELPLLSALGH